MQKQKLINETTRRTIVFVDSYVGQELVFKGEFEMYRSSQSLEGEE